MYQQLLLIFLGLFIANNSLNATVSFNKDDSYEEFVKKMHSNAQEFPLAIFNLEAPFKSGKRTREQREDLGIKGLFVLFPSEVETHPLDEPSGEWHAKSAQYNALTIKLQGFFIRFIKDQVSEFLDLSKESDNFDMRQIIYKQFAIPLLLLYTTIPTCDIIQMESIFLEDLLLTISKLKNDVRKESQILMLDLILTLTGGLFFINNNRLHQALEYVELPSPGIQLTHMQRLKKEYWAKVEDFNNEMKTRHLWILDAFLHENPTEGLIKIINELITKNESKRHLKVIRPDSMSPTRSIGLTTDKEGSVSPGRSAKRARTTARTSISLEPEVIS